MKSLHAPLSPDEVQALQAGDYAGLSGVIYTGRDAVHQYLANGGESPVDLRGSVIYHCGPVMIKTAGRWRVTAAGPTTSIREEAYMPEIIARFGLRGIIGKGGMGRGTLAACREYGCVYFHAVGGAAQLLADAITDVKAVYLKEQFGSPEAIWELAVTNFPVIVTMDAHGNSLHTQVEAESRDRLQHLLYHSDPGRPG